MKTLAEIQKEQHAWSLKNFGPHSAEDPFDGLIEEFGELHHAVLKRRQGIRGTAEEHDAAERDALGDMVIYLLDLLSTLKLEVLDTGRERKIESAESARELRIGMLAAIFYLADDMRRPLGEEPTPVDPLCKWAQGLLGHMTAYAETRGWSLLQIVNETWEEVAKRDWTKEREAGGSGEQSHAQKGREGGGA